MTKHLSPSKIKTLLSCSWTYWCKYHEMLPDSNNDGARRGSICHGLWEHLGAQKRRSLLKKIQKKQDILSEPLLARYVSKYMRKMGLVGVNDKGEDNLKMINDMALIGLSHDFLGADLGKPSEAHSEIKFDIKIDDGEVKYRILGYIDKLFLYKKKAVALIRDFKTSKSVFSPYELDDNMQDLFYRLAVRHLFPAYKDLRMEFLFVRFPLEKGLVSTKNVSEEELRGFEYQLTALQQHVEDFSEKDARKNFAARQRFPASDEGFKGPLLCGFAKNKGQLKKDGSIMWHCPFKFGFEYYLVFDNEDKRVFSVHADEFSPSLIPKGGRCEKKKYAGCPMYR